MGSGEKNLVKTKIKIGVNIRIYEEIHSGIQNFITGLFNELSKNKKYDYLFFTTGKKRINKESTHILANSNLLHLINKFDPRLAKVFFDNLYVLKLIMSHRVKIFVSPSFILPLFKPKGVFYVTVIHDLSFLKYRHNPLKIYNNLVLYMKFLLPLVLKRADIVIVDSNYVKKEIKKEYPNINMGKIYVIYPGKNGFFYKIADKKNFTAVVEKFNISQEYCFTNATNHERKNIYGLIDAFSKINKFSQFQLVITGLLPETTILELKEYIHRLNLDNKIKFLGFVTNEELRILYSCAKIFIFPSFEEGFGLPVLESASCGCLPVCSNTGALPEVIGNKRLLFNPRDIQSIVQKINEILLFDEADYNRELAIVQKHIKKFTWEKAAKEYDHLFEKIMHNTL